MSWNTEPSKIAVFRRFVIVCWTLGLVATSQWENLHSCLKNSPACRIQILSSLPHLGTGRMGHCVFYSVQWGHRYEYIYLNYFSPAEGDEVTILVFTETIAVLCPAIEYSIHLRLSFSTDHQKTSHMKCINYVTLVLTLFLLCISLENSKSHWGNKYYL
jgi:hypothetical protein